MRIFSTSHILVIARRATIMCTCLGVVAAISTVQAADGAFELPTAGPAESTIARVAARTIAHEHYMQYMLDDEISANLLDEYIRTLDPQRLYFRQADIAYFSSFRRVLDDFLLEGDIDFAFDVYRTLVTRVGEWHSFIQSQRDNPLDFTVHESYQPNRSGASWCQEPEDSRELWRLAFKNDVLVSRLTADSDSAAATVFQSYERKLRDLRTNTAADVLEMYLSSLARVYDPHSSYMSPTTRDNFNIAMNLSLEGIGAALTVVDGTPTVVRVLPGGPSARDGRLRWGDRIVAVAEEDGERVDLANLPLRKIVSYIRGPRGSRINLYVIDADEDLAAEPEIIGIIRDTVDLKGRQAKAAEYKNNPVADTPTTTASPAPATPSEADASDTSNAGETEPTPSADMSAFESTDQQINPEHGESAARDRIVVISLPSFYTGRSGRKGSGKIQSSARDIRDRLQQSVTPDTLGVVIDLRSNHGGSMADAVAMAGLFIREGPVVQVRNVHGQVKVHNDMDPEIHYDGPLAVLLNRYSASASEIFAAAIQDHHRGVIVGDEKTHGKGTVQHIRSLKPQLRKSSLFKNRDPGSLKLTVSKFYRVTGASTQRNGVTPDIILPSPRDIRSIGESRLRNALFWDSVDPRPTLNIVDVGRYIPALQRRSELRVSENLQYRRLVDDIASYKAQKRPRLLSLHLETRKEYERNQKTWKQTFRRHERREADAALQEAMRIVTDLAEMMAHRDAQ